MKRALLLICICLALKLFAQKKPDVAPPSLFKGFVEMQPTLTSSDSLVPFWMRSRQYGSVPPGGASCNFLGGFKKDYAWPSKKLLDYGFSVEGRANVGSRVDWILPEAYVKGRLSIFELRGGRTKEFFGLVDSTLSSGAFSMSGNALGVPKVQISIPEYYTLPFLGRLFAFKGTFAHGWFGEKDIRLPNIPPTESYLHQKSLYGRFGKASWKVKVFGGINHQVCYGNEKQMYGSIWKISDWETYKYVVLGETYGTRDVAGSKVGNSIGSVDAAIQYNPKNIQLFLYHQFFYDIGALGHFANLRDGLTGLSISNTKPASDKLQWKKLVLEFFYSKDQAGYPWSKRTPSGDEDYYNSYVYLQGWSYQGMGLGNPLISNRIEVRDDAVKHPKEYFVNNRVVALYLASAFAYRTTEVMLKLSYSRNYGTFATSEYGLSVGNTFLPPLYGIFQEVDQFCSYLEINKQLKHGFRVGGALALDHGDLLYNSSGLMLKVGKRF